MRALLLIAALLPALAWAQDAETPRIVVIRPVTVQNALSCTAGTAHVLAQGTAGSVLIIPRAMLAGGPCTTGDRDWLMFTREAK